MANIKSAMKRAKTNRIRTIRNRRYKSELKTSIKKFEQALEAGNTEDAKIALTNATKKLDKAVTKGLLHKNTAARHKSKLTRKMNRAI